MQFKGIRVVKKKWEMIYATRELWERKSEFLQRVYRGIYEILLAWIYVSVLIIIISIQAIKVAVMYMYYEREGNEQKSAISLV